MYLTFTSLPNFIWDDCFEILNLIPLMIINSISINLSKWHTLLWDQSWESTWMHSPQGKVLSVKFPNPQGYNVLVLQSSTVMCQDNIFVIFGMKSNIALFYLWMQKEWFWSRDISPGNCSVKNFVYRRYSLSSFLCPSNGLKIENIEKRWIIENTFPNVGWWDSNEPISRKILLCKIRFVCSNSDIRLLNSFSNLK